MKTAPRSPLREILVVHQTHTDWGYTTHQGVIGEKHCRYIDDAVALCRRHRDDPPEVRFRWTCESAWVVREYLRTRAPAQRKAFFECLRRKEMDVAGLPLHPTALANRKTMDAALTVLNKLRDEGIRITAALGCDINGLSWPWADALLDAGITGLGMSMNFVCGGGLPRWTTFRWRAPSGRTLLCWQGTHYNQGAYWGLNHDVYPIEKVAPQRIRDLAAYPRDKILLQVSNIPCDNMGPNPRYTEYIRRYNRLAGARGFPRMRTALLHEWFAYLAARTETLPEYGGDWTDWWNSGSPSTPRETAALVEAQRRTDLAERWGADPAALHGVRRAIFLGAEHTWGDSGSVNHPWKVSTVAQLAAKQTLLCEPLYRATELLRDSLPAGRYMLDPVLEGFDPGWSAHVDEKKKADNLRTLCPKTRRGPAAPWKRLLPRGPRVVLERPADDKRRTWFETGMFNKPESHGQWPDNAKWIRTPAPGATVTRTEEGDVLRIETRVTLPHSTDPRALYIDFPFAVGPIAGAWADVGGAWADPRRDMVPGACANWWTIHRGVLLTGDFGSLLWTPWDAPLTMFDEICPNPPKPSVTLKKARLISWAANNYWWTNFAGMLGGEYVFRHRIKYWPKPVSPAEAERFCETDPLPAYPKLAGRSA